MDLQGSVRKYLRDFIRTGIRTARERVLQLTFLLLLAIIGTTTFFNGNDQLPLWIIPPNQADLLIYRRPRLPQSMIGPSPPIDRPIVDDDAHLVFEVRKSFFASLDDALDDQGAKVTSKAPPKVRTVWRNEASISASSHWNNTAGVHQPITQQSRFSPTTSTTTIATNDTTSRKTTIVILLAYQRTGSSYIGNLFNMNPDALYIFEPLDAVYTTLYGTRAGWNVPTDIFNMPNGERRIIPDEERRAVVSVLRLLTCDTSRVPQEVLLHPFWVQFFAEQRRLNKFISCLYSSRSTLRGCQLYLKHYCPERFGANHAKHEQCRIGLASFNGSSPQEQPTMLRLQHTIENSYLKNVASHYKTSLNMLTLKNQQCEEAFRSVCSETTLKATKTVRLDMRSLEMLLQSVPAEQEVMIIHLFRDPASVALSRMGDESFKGLGVRSVVDAARFYCADLREDLKERRKLEAKYPGRFYQLLFEDFVNDPTRQVEKVYEFLGLPCPASVKSWFRYRRSREWMKMIKRVLPARAQKVEEIGEIKEACKDLYDLFGEKWKR